MKKPKILLTNDDGIYAPGLKSLWRALVDHAEMSIVAPSDDMSGTGTSITVNNPLKIDKVNWEKGTPAWKVNGRPADCVKLGIGALIEKPDLIVSGINRGSNLGSEVFYSGTVGGVIEGALKKIPGIAFSYDEHDSPDFTVLEKYILPIVHHVLEHPLPKGTLLNVNFPDLSKPIKGFKLARQGQAVWVDTPDERIHPMQGTPYFWHGGAWNHTEGSDDTDVSLIQQGFITAVPIRVDELTHHDHLEAHKELFEKTLNNLLHN